MTQRSRKAMILGALCVAATLIYFGIRQVPRARVGSGAAFESGADPGSAPDSSTGALTASAARASEEQLQMAQVRQAILQGAMNGSPAPAPPDAATHARETLDERMANAPPDPERTLAMERALQVIVDSGVLNGVAATFVCGSTMCRADLQDAEDSRVVTASSSLTEHAPKLFASAVIYPQALGSRAVYLTRRPEDLMLAPPSQGTQEIVNDAGPSAR